MILFDKFEVMLLLDVLVEEEKESGARIALGAEEQSVEAGLVEQAARVDEHDVVVDAVEHQGGYQRGLALLLRRWEVHDSRADV